MSDAFRESNTETYRNIVTFQSGFGVIADEPFIVGSPTTTGSTLTTYNLYKPLGGVSGYVPYTGANGHNIYVPEIISGLNYHLDLNDGTLFDNFGGELIDLGGSSLIGGTTSVDWSSRWLVGNLGDTRLDWQNCVLYDIPGNNSINWDNRKAFDIINQYLSFDWDKRILYSGSESGMSTLDWGNRVLSGVWNSQGILVSGNPVLTGTTLPSVSCTTSINWATSNTFYATLTGNTTFTFTGQRDGQTIVVSVNNTGTNHFTGAWPTGVKWPFQTAPVQTSGAFTDIYTFVDITGTIYGNAVQSY